MPKTPTIQEVIRRAIEANREELHTALPGRVQKFDKARNTADIIPQLRRALERADGTFQLEDLPIIPDVPIAWPRGGGGSKFITWPLVAGDPVQLIFNERDIGLWREQGEPGAPGDNRCHTLAGAVAVPSGLAAKGDLIAAGDVSDTHVVIGDSVMLGSASAGESIILGDAFKATYDTHTHSTAMGPTGAPTPLLTELSTKHKVDS
jgi:hypothetical protein